MDNIPINTRFSNKVIVDTFNNKVLLHNRKIFSTKIKELLKFLYPDPDNVIIFGTGRFTSLYYSSGDIDTTQFSRKGIETPKKLIKWLSHILKNLKKHNLTFLEIKSGFNPYYNIDIGKIDSENYNTLNGINSIIKDYNPKYIREELKKKGLNDLIKLVSNSPKITKWMELFETLRQKYTLRWTEEEFFKGYKIVDNNGKKEQINFIDTLYQPMFTKLDILVNVDERIIPVDCLYKMSEYSILNIKNNLLLNALFMLLNGRILKFIKRINGYNIVFDKKDKINSIYDIWKILYKYRYLISINKYTEPLIDWIKLNGFKDKSTIIQILNNCIVHLSLISENIVNREKQNNIYNNLKKILDDAKKEKNKKILKDITENNKYITDILNEQIREQLYTIGLLPLKPIYFPRIYNSFLPRTKQQYKHNAKIFDIK